MRNAQRAHRGIAPIVTDLFGRAFSTFIFVRQCL